MTLTTVEMTEVTTQHVRQQLARILAEPSFRASKRSSRFLTFVVEETLNGNQQIKERLIGAAVFGREPAYDTAVDHVVRTAATELRKRLALYYSSSRHSGELVISLPPGSYIPHFDLHQADAPLDVKPVDEAAPGDGRSLTPATTELHRESSTEITPLPARGSLGAIFSWRRTLWAALFSGILIVGFVSFGHKKPSPASPELEAFLGPSAEQVFACVGAPSLSQNQPLPESATKPENLGAPAENNVLVPFSDARAMTIATSIVQRSGRAIHVELARFCNFSDLRAGPNILIGALDNAWTLRLVHETPFRFEGTDSGKGTLIHQGQPAQLIGEVNFNVPYFDRTQDFGILALFRSETLSQPTIIIAGIGPNGTLAAAELLADSKRLDGLLKAAKRGNGKANVAFALATDVIQGRSGPPKVVDTESW